RSLVALVADIMFNLSAESSSMEHVEGMVLLDEIETHLHPRWKMQVVGILRNIFPRVRFIATTHDPLCLRGVRDREVCLLEKAPRTQHVRDPVLDVPKGMRADQLLTGQWFGLHSTLDEDTLGLMEKHRRLLVSRQTRASVDERRAIEHVLRERLNGF